MSTEILVTEFMGQEAIDRLADVHETRYLPDIAVNRDALLREAVGIRALVVRNRTQVDEELLQVAQDLVCVGRLGVGTDNIDMDACERRDIAVHVARGANDQSVAEYIVAAAMMLLRNAYQVTDKVIDGRWPRTDCMGSETYGKTLGVIGFGAIGHLAASKARHLGMQILAHDPMAIDLIRRHEWAEAVDLNELLTRSDVVSLHVPYLETTHHLINSTTLAQCKPGMVLINASRGGVVDEEALVAFLRDGRIGGAMLDVFEHEPLDTGHGSKFRDAGNLILTPHIAGVTKESNQRVSNMIADRVLKELAGMA